MLFHSEEKNAKELVTHFQWDNVPVHYNVLYAIGYVNGKPVTRDHIVLNHLPAAPHFNDFFKDAKPILKPKPGYNYIYRINCGGPEYKDENGNIWSADKTISNNYPAAGKESSQLQGNNYNPQTFFGSVSWPNDFPGMPSLFASQRRTSDVIHETKDWKLFRIFATEKINCNTSFPCLGEYLIELYFTEPWLGIGGGNGLHRNAII